MIKIIQTSQKDILHGEQGNCYTCPIARAILRRVKKDVLVNVGSFKGMVGFTYNGIIKNVIMPQKAYDWYSEFDSVQDPVARINFGTIRFELDIPDWALV